ncbi:hypothetical protein [Allokutzneria sp. NRRL B-24872]|nr:hypothetical protein [Allokutzneria sp. NRRL B-24872]
MSYRRGKRGRSWWLVLSGVWNAVMVGALLVLYVVCVLVDGLRRRRAEA